jgi:rhodanese-related sulfurtransferase
MCTNQDANITAAHFFKKMTQNADDPNWIIIDIRTEDEYDVYHIDNAINIDFYNDTFPDEINALDKNKTYLIYCRTGRRTGTDENNALALMQNLGFRKVYNMLGGIHDFVKVPGTDDVIV